VFDGVLGLFAYLILRLRYRRSYASIIGVLVIVFAPTIVINSAAWGQSDAIYAACCLGSLYFLLNVTLVFALAIPFLLPEMHERYFYLADVVSIIFAFYFPRYFYIAVVIQLCSLLSYAPYFLNTQVVNLAYLAFAVITLVDLVLSLYPNIRKRAAVPVPTQSTASQP
jgi:Gpi18-like mannosyltransferase